MKRLLLLLVLLLPAPLWAQQAEEKVPRGEIGLFYEYQRDVNSDLNLHGYGARVTVNATRWLALETTLALDPKRQAVPVRFLHQEFAAKLTYRHGRAGVFGFIGPGYINARAFGFSATRPTLKWGGGVEYYPSQRVGLRIDAGHLTTFFPGGNTANFILQSGISFRF